MGGNPSRPNKGTQSIPPGISLLYYPLVSIFNVLGDNMKPINTYIQNIQQINAHFREIKKLT